MPGFTVRGVRLFGLLLRPEESRFMRAGWSF
jgi:hypothetical protein